MNKSRGFTLIELLVVIAIIGVLSAIILVALGDAKGKANDTKRLADLKQVQKAVELYYDANGSYPDTGGSWYGACGSWDNQGTTGSGGWVPNLAPKYIPVLPLDPKPNLTSGRCYLYRSNGTDYIVMAHRTVESYDATSNKWPRPSNPTDLTFAFYSNGGKNW